MNHPAFSSLLGRADAVLPCQYHCRRAAYVEVKPPHMLVSPHASLTKWCRRHQSGMWRRTAGLGSRAGLTCRRICPAMALGRPLAATAC